MEFNIDEIKGILVGSLTIFIMVFPFITGCAAIFFVWLGNAELTKMDITGSAIVSILVTIGAVCYLERCAQCVTVE